MFFDASESKFSRDGKQQIFEGRVVAIAAGTLVAADKIEVDRTKNVMSATGNILVLSANQVFTGTQLVYHMSSGDFKLEDAMLVTNDSKRVAKITRKVLGFTPEEVAFEAAKTARLAEIEKEKQEIQVTYRDSIRAGGIVDESSLVAQYTILLERQALIKSQENLAMQNIPKDLRGAYKRRRKFWNANKNSTVNLANGKLSTSYFKIIGDRIERTNGNDLKAEEAYWTTCKCADDEIPAWGFRAETIKAQVGGYADLHHPVLEIKGIPILYVPFIKIPIKDERQTGFLLPVFTFDKKSGNIYSQPVYFAIDREVDVTINTDWIEKRGTRLGFEYRHQLRTHSGWSLQVEGIRDRLWLQERSDRSDLVTTYSNGLSEARRRFAEGQTLAPDEDPVVNTPEWWQQNRVVNDKLLGECLATDPNDTEEKCNIGLKKRMAIPLNDWRGRMDWAGGVFFAPRLSLVSEGELFSDHRYADDLYFARDFKEVLSQQNRAQSFSKIKWQTHLDARNLYLGIGSSFGDNMNLDGRYAGQQIPVRFKAQSRMFPVFGEEFPLPTYVQFDFENLNIDFNQSLESDKLDGQTDETFLGSGSWQRSRIRFIAPLVNKQIITMNHFTDLEARLIRHEGLSEPSSRIQTWRTGFRINLPVDGTMVLPKAFQKKQTDQNVSPHKKYVRHVMDWGMTLSLRPSVVREGLYGEVYNVVGEEGQPVDQSKSLTYFASDQKSGTTGSQFVIPGETMIPEKKVAFSTSHSWTFFDRGWKLLPAQKKVVTGKQNTQTSSENLEPTSNEVKPTEISEVGMEEVARRELMYSLDRQVKSGQDMFGGNRWFVNRYRVTDSGSIRPLTFSSTISYDFFQEKLRQEQIPILESNLEGNKEIDRLADDLIQTDPENPEIKKQATDMRNQKVKISALPEPWSVLRTNLRLTLSSWSISSIVDYNVYQSKASKAIVSLGFPGFWKSGLGIAYELANSSVIDGYGGYKDEISKVRTISLSSRLLPKVVTSVVVSDKISAKQVLADQESNQFFSENYQTVIGLSYKDPSDCWGLNFSRQKKYGVDERNSSYKLQLVVNLIGQTRSLPSMSPGIVRELPIGPDEP